MKRFYNIVATGKSPGGYTILLDGKPVKVPSGALLCTPHKALAEAIVREWVAQGDHVIPDSMPLMQILTTQIDRVSRERAAMCAALLKYLDTDLLCYRAPEPPVLLKAQEAGWNPWLVWFEKEFGAPLQTTTTLFALKQDQDIVEKVSKQVAAMRDEIFTVFQLVTPLSGSIVLGLAFVEGALSPEQLFDAVHIEETHKARIYNEELHGPDPLQEKKDEAMKRDLAASKKFLEYTTMTN